MPEGECLLKRLGGEPTGSQQYEPMVGCMATAYPEGKANTFLGALYLTFGR